MSSRALVRRNNGGPVIANQRMALAAARNILRRAIRRRARHRVGQLARQVASVARQRMARQRQFDRNRYGGHRIGTRRFYKIIGNASGTTHTTTRMIVRKTPKEQKFIRKLLRTNPLNQKYVERFGFSWMGNAGYAKTAWYSCCHLKFNNLVDYMQNRPTSGQYQPGVMETNPGYVGSITMIANGPDAFIYIGKCTFSYEIFNPTNYNMTVYIYDLILKRDTPFNIQYNNPTQPGNNAPEACMNKGSDWASSNNQAQANASWVISDPTNERDPTTWNSIGIKPTDYHYFNTFWKVKGIKKIILPPTTSHHHNVVFNPKIKLTQAGLFFPRNERAADFKGGIAGITQATLFGFQGQVAAENDTATNNTSEVSTLPGKLILNCVRKVNVWTQMNNSQTIISSSHLKSSMTKPTIFTDLVEQDAMAT